MKLSRCMLLAVLSLSQAHYAFEPQKTQSEQEKLIAQTVTLLARSKEPVAQKLTLSPLSKNTRNEASSTTSEVLAAQEDPIKKMYTTFFLLPRSNNAINESELSKALEEAKKDTDMLKKHFFLSIIPGTPDVLMRCEIPDQSAPGGKMIVSGQIQIKACNNIFKNLQACCSERSSL